MTGVEQLLSDSESSAQNVASKKQNGGEDIVFTQPSPVKKVNKC